MDTNLYDILGLSKNASFDEIKAKYKSLAQQHHPDKGGNENLFKEIIEAYETLSDPSKKENYDRFGHNKNFSSKSLTLDCFAVFLLSII
jgi:DnaJ-class molecular chaperone